MLAYSTEKSKGRYIAFFWAIFNVRTVRSLFHPSAPRLNFTASTFTARRGRRSCDSSRSELQRQRRGQHPRLDLPRLPHHHSRRCLPALPPRRSGQDGQGRRHASRRSHTEDGQDRGPWPLVRPPHRHDGPTPLPLLPRLQLVLHVPGPCRSSCYSLFRCRLTHSPLIQQFNAFNGGGLFTYRARTLNNLLYWSSQILGSGVISLHSFCLPTPALC